MAGLKGTSPKFRGCVRVEAREIHIVNSLHQTKKNITDLRRQPVYKTLFRSLLSDFFRRFCSYFKYFPFCVSFNIKRKAQFGKLPEVVN